MLMGRRCEQQVSLKPTKRNRRIAPAPMPRDDLSSAFFSSRTFHAPLHVLIEYVCSVSKFIISLVYYVIARVSFVSPALRWAKIIRSLE